MVYIVWTKNVKKYKANVSDAQMLIAALNKNTELNRFLDLYRECYDGTIRFIIDRKDIESFSTFDPKILRISR